MLMIPAQNEGTSASDARGVVDLALSPVFTQDGIGFAATRQGLLKTIDGGCTWTDAFATLPSMASLPVTAVALSPRFAEDRTVVAAIPGGIGWSEGWETSWRFAHLPLPAPHVTALAISPDARFAFAATLQDGVFRSEDAGRSWTPWNFGLIDMSVQALAVSPAFARDETVFAGTSTGLMRSRNAGRSWHTIELPVDCPAIVSMAYADASLVVAALDEPGIFRSSDGGATWSAYRDERFHLVSSLATHQVEPGRQDIIALTDAGPARSTDGGQTWHLIDMGKISSHELTCAVSGGAGIFIAGDAAGNLHRITV
jgi:photosystem II stability/assembly factor-like uncharacterized protein